MKKPLLASLALASLAIALAGCGTRPADRVGGGAAVGAGSGAVIGAIFGAGIGAIPGALIGAGVGAGTGAVTTPSQIDLGRPAWDQASR